MWSEYRGPGSAPAACNCPYSQSPSRRRRGGHWCEGQCIPEARRVCTLCVGRCPAAFARVVLQRAATAHYIISLLLSLALVLALLLPRRGTYLNSKRPPRGTCFNAIPHAFRRWHCAGYSCRPCGSAFMASSSLTPPQPSQLDVHA